MILEIYSTYNEGKSVVAQRFIRTLNNKIYKYMTSISKNVYIDKFDDIVNNHNSTYYRTIKIKAFDVNLSTYIDFNKENIKEDPKFEIDGDARISKYKNIFAKRQIPIWSKKVKNTASWTYAISGLAGNCWNVLRKRIAKNKLRRV